LDSGDEVVLGRAHFTLGTIDTVIAGGDKARLNIEAAHSVRQLDGQDIIEDFVPGFETFAGEESNGRQISIFIRLRGFRCHGDNLDIVGIRMVQEEEVTNAHMFLVEGG
jgi:hypothetical protein